MSTLQRSVTYESRSSWRAYKDLAAKYDEDYKDLKSKLDIAIDALEFVANDGYSSTSENGVPDRSEFWNKARQALEKIR